MKILDLKRQTQILIRGVKKYGVRLMLGSGVFPMGLAQSPLTPPEITPLAGHALFLTTQATGTQNYLCSPSVPGGSNVSVFLPQATLEIPLWGESSQQVITHFLSPVPGENLGAKPAYTVSPEMNELNCPTWQSSFDSSAVWGERVGSLPAGTDSSCPTEGAIPCLLLKAVTTRTSQYGGPGLLGKTTYIQRLKTVGGTAPTASCSVGDQILVSYRATYLFFLAEHQ